jgi:hypothetical protein
MKFWIICLAIFVILLCIVLYKTEHFVTVNKSIYSNLSDKNNSNLYHRKHTGFNFSSPNWNFGGPL